MPTREEKLQAGALRITLKRPASTLPKLEEPIHQQLVERHRAYVDDIHTLRARMKGR